MAAAVCKLNKFGHCKYSKHCFYQHVDVKCETQDCNPRYCDLRHPKDCRNISRYGFCKFGKHCDFEHNREHLEDISELEEVTQLKVKLDKKVLELENLIIEKIRGSLTLKRKFVLEFSAMRVRILRVT
jgi:hypothetical protein